VEAGASKIESATKRTRSVSIGDEARAGKIEWGEGICLPTAAASALRGVMVWGRMRGRDVTDGGECVLGGRC
jgi:hypothetical protein